MRGEDGEKGSTNTLVAVRPKPTFTPVYERRFMLVHVSNHGLDLPEETYILVSPALEEILFDRALVGHELEKATYRASRALFEALKTTLMEEYPSEVRFEQVNLAGSVFYQLPEAHARIFNAGLPRNFIGLSREPIPGEFDEQGRQLFQTKITYPRFEAEGQLLICGETVATGISASDGFRAHLPYAIEHGLEAILLFSIAGSKVGAERIYETIKEFRTRDGNSIRTIFVFGLGMFGLGKDGTALLWHSEDEKDDPITLPEYALKGREVFLPGECNIGDWGERFTAPVPYLGGWQNELRRLGHPERFRVPEKYLSHFFPERVVTKVEGGKHPPLPQVVP